MSEYREFTGKSVEEALKLAREAFGADLNDLDFEILTPGSRGVLGMGAEPARIVAAPRTALGGAAPKREAAAAVPLPPAPPREDRPRDDRPPRRDDRPRDDRPQGDRPPRAPGLRRVTVRHAATTDPATTARVATARRAATTDPDATIDRRRPAAGRPTCPPPRPPRSRPPVAPWPPSVRISKPPRPRPRLSPPARRSSSS